MYIYIYRYLFIYIYIFFFFFFFGGGGCCGSFPGPPKIYRKSSLAHRTQQQGNQENHENPDFMGGSE